MSYSGASCSLTLFNLQGTRLIRQELNYTTLGNRCQELFSRFFNLKSFKSLSHSAVRVRHELIYFITGFSVCQALFSEVSEVFSSEPSSSSAFRSDELGYYTVHSRICQVLFSRPLRLPDRVSPSQAPVAQALDYYTRTYPILSTVFFKFLGFSFRQFTCPLLRDSRLQIDGCRWTLNMLRFY